MEAKFNQSPQVIQAAAERAGLTLIRSPLAYPTWDGDVSVGLVGQEGHQPQVTAAFGSPNTLMRLIGALADDGQDCLLEVTS